MADTPEPEGQDLAETFDEETLTGDGQDIVNGDELPDVLDVTSLPEDAAIEGPADEGPPRTRLEDRPETDLEGESPAPDQEDGGAEAPKPADFESQRLSDHQLADLGYGPRKRQGRRG